MRDSEEVRRLIKRAGARPAVKREEQQTDYLEAIALAVVALLEWKEAESL